MAASSYLGRYALYDVLGSGGMARVHVGRLLGPVGFRRVVAIKALHPHLAAQDRFVAMLLDEARLAGRVRHPSVVPVLDIVTGDRTVALVMEYVHGESLSGLLSAAAQRGGGIDPAIVSAVVVGVLEGLHAAHEAKNEDGTELRLVHRDVSPQNILVGVDGVARVSDFGIAKATTRLQTTETGELKGKWRYMAPEQFRGAEATSAADLWAAGVVLWEMLTLRRFYEKDTQLSEALRRRKVAPPSSAGATTTAFDEIVLRALADQPEDRFASARAMAEALERACPIASHRAVGAWVTELAGDELAMREALIERVEREDLGPPEAHSALTEAAPAADVNTPAWPGRSARPETAKHDVAPQAEARRTSRAPLAVAIVGTVLILGFALYAGRSADPAPVSASSSAPPAAPPSVTAVVERRAEAPPSSPPRVAPSAAPPSSKVVVVKPARSAPASPATSSVNCTPPYTVGPPPELVRHPKPECFQ